MVVLVLVLVVVSLKVKLVVRLVIGWFIALPPSEREKDKEQWGCKITLTYFLPVNLLLAMLMLLLFVVDIMMAAFDVCYRYCCCFRFTTTSQ